MDDDDLKFRDECAIQVLQALIGRGYCTEYVKHILDENTDPTMTRIRQEALEGVTIAAYKIADAMRKARLASFK